MDAVKQLIRKSLTAELRKKLSQFSKDLIDGIYNEDTHLLAN
jgi:hypothetical protein